MTASPPPKTIVISPCRAHAFADCEAEAVARAFLLGDEHRLYTSSMLVINAAIMLIAEDVADACIVEHNGHKHVLGARGTERAGSFPGLAPTLLSLGMDFARRTLTAREAYRDDPCDMDLLGALARRGWTLVRSSKDQVVFGKEGKREDGSVYGEEASAMDLKSLVRHVSGLSPKDFWALDKRQRRADGERVLVRKQTLTGDGRSGTVGTKSSPSFARKPFAHEKARSEERRQAVRDRDAAGGGVFRGPDDLLVRGRDQPPRR